METLGLILLIALFITFFGVFCWGLYVLIEESCPLGFLVIISSLFILLFLADQYNMLDKKSDKQPQQVIYYESNKQTVIEKEVHDTLYVDTDGTYFKKVKVSKD